MKTLIKACFVLLVISTTSYATEIRLVVNDGPNEGFNDNGAAVPNQTNNSGSTLGQQRLNVFQAAADYWEERIISDVPVRVGVQFNVLFCSPFSATLGSAGPRGIFRNFPNAPLANTWFVGAVADSLSGFDRQPSRPDIEATFNSGIDNNDDCLRGTNWWLGIDSPAPRGTISLFDTVLHEIGHGLGVLSLVSQNGSFNGGFNDAYSYHLFDETINTFWRDMTDTQRQASAINDNNLVWRGPNADANSGHITSGKTNGRIRIYAPNPYEPGSSVSHWDTSLVPDELMEPSATPTSDDRSTIQLLKDVGWRIVEGSGSINFESSAVTVVEDSGPAVLQLRRSNGGDGAVSVRVNSSNISAIGGGVDYNSISNQLVSWADGETGVKTVLVTVIDDDIVEAGGETALFTISNATGGVTIGSQNTTTLTINDPVIVPPSEDDDDDFLLFLIPSIISATQ